MPSALTRVGRLMRKELGGVIVTLWLPYVMPDHPLELVESRLEPVLRSL